MKTATPVPRRTRLLLSVALLCLAACGGDAPAPDTGSPVMLPEAYYGTWELAGTSGGLDGMGVPLPEGPRVRVVLTRENIWKQRGPDGSVARPFTVRKGKTIFSTDDQWMVVWGSGSGELVLQLAADGQLTTSENVYDGFSSSYRRVASSP